MLSSNNHMAAASSPTNSLCEGSISPSSAHSHSQPSTHELDSSQQSLRNDNSSDDPTDFSSLRGPESLANLPANIEIHPQNDALSSTSSSHQQFIKRPLNAYMIWTRQERRKILTGEPKKKMNEVSKAMGERWKKMSDKEKKPYFEMARKFANEHKQALQEHPELTYAPSKKKMSKAEKEAKREMKAIQQEQMDQSTHSTPCASTPDPSPRSITPRQAPLQPPPVGQPTQQQTTPMFMPFQTPFNAGAMQIAQVLGVRTPSTTPALTVNPYGLPLAPSTVAPNAAQPFMQTPQIGQQPHASAPPNFIPPSLQHPRFTVLQQPVSSSAIPSTAALSRSTPGQVLDIYYTSLCQPAFPSITEPPLNTTLYPPQYLLEQYNQHFNNNTQNNNNPSAAPHF